MSVSSCKNDLWVWGWLSLLISSPCEVTFIQLPATSSCPYLIPGCPHHQNQNHGLILQWKETQRQDKARGEPWKKQLLVPAIYGIMTTVPYSPCGATRSCTSALARAYGAWDSSLASLPSGSKMQADISCRLPPLAGCHPKHLPRQRASLPIKWTLRARDCRFVSHHGTSYTSKQQQKEVVTTCMSWENLLLSQNFSLSCLLTPKWLAHLYIQRHKAGLAASSCEHKFHNIPQGERATRDFPVWISKKNVKETATICG